MNKTKIEWCDFTINPIKGLCEYACPYCYARRMYKRFKWNPEVRLDLKCFQDLQKVKEISSVFVCSTHDIMGEWIPDEWIKEIIEYCNFFTHTFFFLTKNPERYVSFEWPKSCKLGATVTREKDLWRIDTMRNIGGFISIEPLLEDVSSLSFEKIQWIIIGGLTPKPIHKKEWIDKILQYADCLKVPVFIKDNAYYPIERKERLSQTTEMML